MNETIALPLSLRDYWQIFWLRKVAFFVPFLLTIAVGLAFALLLPPVYRSEATVTIEGQALPSDIVETTVTGYVQERIAKLRNQILTYETRIDLAREHSLYTDRISSDPSYVAQAVNQSAEIATSDVRALDPQVTGERYATVAFTVAFSASTARQARDVAQDLTDRFLELHRLTREEQTADVTRFLEEEAEALRLEIVDLEASLAEFKQEQLRQLPELMDINLQLFERTEQEIERTSESLRGLSDRLNTLQAELSLTEPYKSVTTEEGNILLSGNEKLSSLTAQLLRASARYSAAHPNVKRLRREISLLAQEQPGQSRRIDSIMSDLINLQEKLRTARSRFSDDHPQVKQLEDSIAALQRGLQTVLVANNGATDRTITVPPDNPRYVGLKTQVDATETNISAERNKLEKLQERLTEYEERLFNTPAVERDYKSLSRDYDNSTAKYRDLKEKILQARLAESLELGERAEKWVLVSPAYIPSLPDSPNRLGISLLAVLAASLLGLVGVTIAEYSDTTVRGSRMLTVAAGAPPLAMIGDLQASRS